MRIVLLANRDIASNLALNYLVKGLSEHQLTVFLSQQVGNPTKRPTPLTDLAFFEQRLFNDILFPALSQTNDQALKSFTQLEQTGIAIRPITSVNDEKGLSSLAVGKPHLILSVRFGLILQPQAIAIPEFGVLNLHSGILPDYRGVMATFWAMLNKEKEMGSTLHFIRDASIDTGDVIKINRTEVDYQRSYLWNVLNLYRSGVDSMLDAVASIAEGKTVNTKAQAQNKGSYYSFPDKAALDAFFGRGLKLYDHQEIVDFAKGYL